MKSNVFSQLTDGINRDHAVVYHPIKTPNTPAHQHSLYEWCHASPSPNIDATPLSTSLYMLKALKSINPNPDWLPDFNTWLQSDPQNFPKIDAPFVRETADNGRYLATPDVKPGYEWVFESGTTAVEKLDGTCCAIKITNGDVVQAYTRLGNRDVQPVSPYGRRDHHYVVNGVQNSLNRDYLERLDDGIHFGELIGPAFGGGSSEVKNPHDLDEYLFIPFQRAQRKLTYRSWDDYEQDYHSIRDWFADGLFSLFYCQWNGCDAETSRTDGYCEGIIVTKPGFDFTWPLETESRVYKNHDGSTETVQVATNIAKIRVDMFPQFWTDS